MSHHPPSCGARRLLQASALVLLPLAALAQSSTKPGYLLEGRGDFVRSGTPGQCWHDGQWTPAMAQAECDPVASPPARVSAPPAPASAPAPLAAAAAPQPAPTPAPLIAAVPTPAAAPVLRYAADALFDFDKSTVRPQGRKMLDEASANILGLQGEKIEVVGHTDRLGTEAYNQSLSVRRAESVRDYLVMQGVARDRIATRGVGESEPVTPKGSCAKGRMATVIACLQADRRVDITIEGTKMSKP